MRKSIALLLGTAAIASVFGTTSASASHFCENDVNAGPVTVGVDNPLEGATGIVFVCVTAPVIGECELGGGVHTVITSISPLQVTANPQVYRPCDGTPLLP